MVVFLTGTNRNSVPPPYADIGERPFDGGTGASIHCATAGDINAAAAVDWKYLGVLTNDKPSAIFKLSGGAGTMAAIPPGSRMQVGISIKPLAVLEQLYASNMSKAVVPVGAATATGGAAIPNPVQMAQRIGESMFNYLVSFARPLGALAAQMDAMMAGTDIIRSSTEVVPVQRLQEWFNNLVKRATNDPEGFQRQYLA